MKAVQLFLLISLCYSCNQGLKNSKIETKAILFEPNLISSKLPEFATTINKAGTEIFFNRTTADRSKMQIMQSVLVGNTWTKAKALPFSTGQYRDVDPFLTQDGKRLYFSSTRPKEKGEKGGGYNTWYVERINTAWSEPINPGEPLNSDSTEIFITIANNGNAYFVSERDGDRGIMRSKLINGKYQEAEKIRPTLNGKAIYASNPCIAPDESFLIAAIRDPSGNGKPDLFVSFNNKGQWSEFKNLGSTVNSDFAEFAPGLSKDGNTLYYSSERPGILPAQTVGLRPPGDIYYIHLKSILKKLKD